MHTTSCCLSQQGEWLIYACRAGTGVCFAWTETVVGCDCRATFTLKSLEVRVVALQGKNYVYAVKSLFMPINVDGCHVAASKTKKNVLITLQVGFARPPLIAMLCACSCALVIY